METIEDLYEQIGGLGWFQGLIILTIVSSQVSCGWSMLQMVFAGVVPDFVCRKPCDVGATGTALSCDDEGFQVINGTHNECSYNGTSCEFFDYDTESSTVIVEWGLVCDRRRAKQVIISVQMAGVLVGTLFAGMLSDFFGRKKALAGFVLNHIVFSICAAFSVSWVMFACIRFFAGVGIGGVVVVVFPYIMEFLPSKWRAIAAIIPSWTLGVSIFAGMALWLDDWKSLHIACGVAGVPSLIGICLIPESIRWQAVHGKIAEAEASLAKIAKYNKKRMPTGTSALLRNFSNEQKSDIERDRSYTYVDLFRRPWTAKVSLILWFYWFTMAVAYYGIAFGVASLSGNLYLNIFLLGFTEIPVQCTTFFLNNRFGRRKTTLGFFFSSLVPSIGCLAFTLLARGSVRSVGINVCSQIAKMMVGSVWSCVQLWGNEIYPTVIRNQGGGFTVLGARIGGVMAPFIIDLDAIPAISYGILSSLLFLGCILTTFLPETCGKTLSDTMNQVRVEPTRYPKAEDATSGDKGHLATDDKSEEKETMLNSQDSTGEVADEKRDNNVTC